MAIVRDLPHGQAARTVSVVSSLAERSSPVAMHDLFLLQQLRVAVVVFSLLFDWQQEVAFLLPFRVVLALQVSSPDEQQQAPSRRAESEHPQPLSVQDICPWGSRHVLSITKICRRAVSFTRPVFVADNDYERGNTSLNSTVNSPYNSRYCVGGRTRFPQSGRATDRSAWLFANGLKMPYFPGSGEQSQHFGSAGIGPLQLAIHQSECGKLPAFTAVSDRRTTGQPESSIGSFRAAA